VKLPVQPAQYNQAAEQNRSSIIERELLRLATLIGAGGGTSVHNSLTGIQGGTTGEYYHLTAAEVSTIDGGTP
jgi:hypothetical protein